VLAGTLGCTGQSGAPLSPSNQPFSTEAAADGSTLKVSAPGLVSPIGGGRIQTTSPEFVLNNSAARFTSTPSVRYEIEVQTTAGQTASRATVFAGSGGQTRWTIPTSLGLDTRYRWRARAILDSRGGPWSGFGEFLTIDYRGLVPRPAGGAWPTNGPAVVAYIAASFPERLAVTSLAHRIENMEFLRDRIIEAGICGGLDLAWNLKRGTPELSIDFLVWRDEDGEDHGIDLAAGYDDETQPLQLHWVESIFPFYGGYPNHPGC
jgi:hypothetical protein